MRIPALLLLLPSLALGGENAWTSLGPGSGEFTSVVSDPVRPQVAYSRGISGVHRTDDSGATWRAVDEGLTNKYVNALAIDPRNPDRLLAGTNEGAFLSLDGASSWRQVFSSIPLTGVAISPVDGALFLVWYLGTWRSTDDGRSWSQPGVPPAATSGLFFPPGDGTHLFALTVDGAFVSGDGAASWSPVPLPTRVTSLAGPPEALVAGTESGLFKSADGGLTWAPAGIVGSIRGVAVGASPRIVVALTEDSIFRSTDGGVEWASVEDGIDTSDRTGVALGAAPLEVLYCSGRELSRSLDGGRSWSRTGDELPAWTIQVAISPHDPSFVLVSLADARRLVASHDSGATWTAAASGLPSAPGSFTFDPTRPMHAYAAGVTDGSTRPGLFRTTDGGASWSPCLPAFGSPLTQVVVDPDGVVHAAGSELSGGTYFTTLMGSFDGGATWHGGLQALPGNLFRLAAAGPQRLYAATSTGVYKSSPGVLGWSPILGSGYVQIAVDPSLPGWIYASVFLEQETRFVLLRSSDDGGTWSELPVHDLVQTIALNPSRPGEVFAGTPHGCHRTTDGGDSWRPAGLEWGYVSALSISPGPERVVYAATAAGLMALSGNYVHGDLDTSGSLDVSDLVVLASYLAGNVLPGTLPFVGPLTSADEDRNGRVDLFDLVLMAEEIVEGQPLRRRGVSP